MTSDIVRYLSAVSVVIEVKLINCITREYSEISKHVGDWLLILNHRRDGVSITSVAVVVEVSLESPLVGYDIDCV
ncbi:hypothetical protein AV929_15590 [Haloarcula sp. K1]|nr:hypothetical protein AV929_15590 [Haloarcula sp. K1]